LKDSIQHKLQSLAERLMELDRQLADPTVVGNLDNYRKITKEHAEISPVVALFHDYRKSQDDVAAAMEMARDDKADPETRDFAEDEIKTSRARLVEIEQALQKALLPKDPNDDKNIFIEIRGGTGGDESALFAGDLFRMYTRFAERNRWQVEMISESQGEVGGYKEVIARIVGQGAYSRLKFESGGHRVQRVPATETQGRIHTSAATVAIMPEADDASDIVINPSDVRVDTFRASGAGGQHINKTDSAVRLTHIPTGIVVECQDGRSQHKNKDQAWRVLAARIKDKQTREQQAKEAAERKSLIGSGDRSERIRTYNFPQGRVTDHRINLTLYKIDFIMDGDITELTDALISEHQAEQLAALSDNRA
jgi:peptide chain release factor 1